MIVSIMQPYFLPYIGYFQLIKAADIFVIYDHIKYTKKGWINRNRLLLNGHDAFFSLPLKKSSDTLDVVEKELASDYEPEKLLRQFAGAYAGAPFFDEIFPLLTEILMCQERNLFHYIYHSLQLVCRYLDIQTDIRLSSELPFNQELKGQDKVIAICQALNADRYMNAIGGTALYDRQVFRENKLELQFLQSSPVEYQQFSTPFVPWLSIIDVLMFNPLSRVQQLVSEHYTII